MHPFKLPSKQKKQPSYESGAQQAGITLIESLISLSMIGILALSAVSYGGQYAINLSIESELAALQQHIAYARSEARTFNKEVRLCQSDDGENCTLGPDWAKGWIVYTNTAGNWTRDSAADTLLYTHKATDPRVLVRMCGNYSSGSIKINDDGYLRKNGSFVIKSSDPNSILYKKLFLTNHDNTRVEEGAGCPNKAMLS